MSYPGCDFEVGGARVRGKVAEMKENALLLGNGQRQSLLPSSIVQKRGMSSFLEIPGKNRKLWETLCLHVSLPSLPMEESYSEMVFSDVVRLT